MIDPAGRLATCESSQESTHLHPVLAAGLSFHSVQHDKVEILVGISHRPPVTCVGHLPTVSPPGKAGNMHMPAATASPYYCGRIVARKCGDRS